MAASCGLLASSSSDSALVFFSFLGLVVFSFAFFSVVVGVLPALSLIFVLGVLAGCHTASV